MTRQLARRFANRTGAIVPLILLLAACAPAPGAVTFGKPVALSGMCDASAAAFGSGYALVLSDEDQAGTFLRFFDLRAGGSPVRSVPLDAARLALDKRHEEIDLEAAAVAGSRLFLIGSHSRNRNGKVRLSRQRLFAIEWPVRGSTARVVGRAYTTLLRDVQRELGRGPSAALRQLVLDPDLPPKEGGVNIEAMAAMPDGGLLIGFRSPVVEGRALTVALRNPVEATGGQPARFAAPVPLGLHGHGIRDAVWDAGRRVYWILSGPAQTGSGFGLWTWSGAPGDAPQHRAKLSHGALGVDRDAQPEALALDPATHRLWLFLDEGTRPNGGVPCKASPEKSFHGVEIRVD